MPANTVELMQEKGESQIKEPTLSRKIIALELCRNFSVGKNWRKGN